ncbi:MAG TPA: glucosaminidase domain-containing protein [Opitutus sp.]|nr:glucosaminidase domain-containing protein [Opitutus sp.]
MNPAAAALGAPVRWWRRSPRARRYLLGAAVVGAGVAAWHWLTIDRLPDFSGYDGSAEKKAAFFAYLLPRLHSVNADILADRERLLRIRAKLAQAGSAGYFDERWLRGVAEDYGLDPPGKLDVAFADHLLRRVDIIAPSLVLAQAATESAWGTSRFARHGNNLFGTHAYDGSGITPRHRAAGRRFTVATYDSATESIDEYVHNLNSDDRYRHLRAIRADLRHQHREISGYELADGLDAYSRRGSEYIEIIRAIITGNRLGKYDKG